ncbi:MAG TPA: hypothetical protein VM782_11315 [Stellaceae bacterium]|nr:hypothetical protein [Stellaceae bacterium]
MLITSLAFNANHTLWLVDSDPANPCVRMYTGEGRFPRCAPAVRQIVSGDGATIYGLDAQGNTQYLGLLDPQIVAPGVTTVAVGRDKRVWATKNGTLMRLKPDNSWETMPAPDTPISVKPIDANNVWLQAGSDIPVSKAYRWNGSIWTDAGSPVPIHDLQVGMDGSVFTMDFGRGAMRRYRSDGNWETWPSPPGGYIAVVSQTEIWSGDLSGNTWQMLGTTWFRRSVSNPPEPGHLPPPSAAVDGTVMNGPDVHNGFGAFQSLGIPPSDPRQRAAYDLNNIWYSDGTNLNSFSGWNWSKASSANLTSIGFQATSNPQYDMMWGCDTNNNVYRWMVTSDPDFKLIPDYHAKKIIGGQWSVDPNGNLQASFGPFDPQLGQPILDIACSPSGNTLWAIGMDHKLYYWSQRQPSTQWTPVVTPPAQAVAGNDDAAWVATVPQPGTRRNDVWAAGPP